MKRRNLFFICGLILFCGTIGSKITASAQDTVWNSQGLIVFDNHTEEKNDDVVVDTSDMEKLLQGETGETLFNSSGRIVFDNNTPDRSDDVIFDASDFNTIETKLSVIPEVYYYDRMTEGEECIRYQMEEGEYYPCDENGKKISEVPLSSTYSVISVVGKDHDVLPEENEIQLVLYETADAGSLSAGSAGFVNKKLVLGSGIDNIDYWNKGIAYADSRVEETSQSYEAGYNKGYEAGYQEGEAAGYASGYEAGKKDGYAAGYQEGEKAGYDKGYQKGEKDGYTKGYQEGEDAGYQKGEAAGYDKGYREGEDTGYDKGYQEGEAAGYTKGYQEGKEAGYTKGYQEGEAAGYTKGYQEGEKTGYENGFALGKKEGYQEGHDAGYQEGHGAGYQEGIEFADGCVSESSASYIAGYEKGNQAVKNIINSFSGRELVASETQYSQILDKVILENIDPVVFSQIRFLSTWWYGSGSGNYPDCEAYGENVIWIEDMVTGKVLQTTNCGGRGGNYQTFDISGCTNPVRLKASITWQKGNWGDACGEGWISSVYLKIREG